MYSGDADSIMKMIDVPDSEKSSQISMMVKGKLQDSVIKAKTYAENHGGVDKVEYQPTKYLNDDKTRAVVEINVIFKDSKNKNEKLKLIKVDGNWFIELGY